MQAKKRGEKSMRKKKLNRIPKFKSLGEEAKFWDTHSFVDFEDELKEIDVIIDLQKPKEETLVLRVQKSVKDKLEKIAKAKGINTSSLARFWLMEKLQSIRSS